MKIEEESAPQGLHITKKYLFSFIPFPRALSLTPLPLLPFANILWDLGFLPLAKDNLRHHPRFPKKLHERGEGGR